MKRTAKDVADALRRDYIRKPENPAGLFLEEIGSPDGARRADVLWIQNHGKGIVGHEIKVSRSDVQAELVDPAKAESWKRYCHRWWLVVSDEALVDGLDIPEDWGIKAPPTRADRRQFKVIRDAPRLATVEVTPALHRIATFMAHERQRREWTDVQHQGEVNRLKREIEAARQGRVVIDPMSKKLADAATELRERQFYATQMTADEMVEAIINANAVREIRRNLEIATRERIGAFKRALSAIENDWAVKNLMKLLNEEIAA